MVRAFGCLGFVPTDFTRFITGLPGCVLADQRHRGVARAPMVQEPGSVRTCPFAPSQNTTSPSQGQSFLHGLVECRRTRIWLYRLLGPSSLTGASSLSKLA